MIVSPIITPFRWYSKFYEQNRYDVDCSNTCEFKLITDRGHLLPFQFIRDSSGYLIDQWLLRRACDAAEPKLLTDENSKWYGDYENYWTLDGDFHVYCKILRSGMTDGDTVTRLNLLTIGKSYRLTFSIADLSLTAGSDLYLKFFEGSNIIINNVNDLGYYEAEFTATTTDFHFDVHQTTSGITDYIGVEGIQIVELFMQNGNDIVLDQTLLKLINVGADDYFIYCGTDLGQSLPCGDYYSIITTADGTVYYSEIITIRDFITDKAPYYILEWSNSCDIQDVIYQTVGAGAMSPGCAYINLLYLNEAVITKPEYPFKEEGETDGNKTLTPTFQKWEKDIQFLIGKCPEYIVDALTGIRLHDAISVTKPLRKEQLQVTSAIAVQSVEYDIAYINNDCFANVNLKLLLPDKYIDSACCSNNELTECLECSYTITTAPNDFTDDGEGHYAFSDGLGEATAGVYLWNSGTETWDLLVVPDETIACVQETEYLLLPGTGDGWVIVPSINEVVYSATPSPNFTVIGYAYPGSFVQLEVWSDEFPEWTPGSEILSAAAFELLGFNVFLSIEETIGTIFRVRNFTLNCTYGYSATWDVSEHEAS